MGGHGDHGHHHEPYKIPDYRIYKVKDCPELLAVEKALASQGLKDPWLRNEVWRYNKEAFGTPNGRLRRFFFRGFGWGVAALGVTIIGEYLYEKYYPSEHGHGGHH